MPSAAAGIKYHNHTKVLLCYLLAWGLALLLPYLGLRFVYPYKLAGTAPDLSQTLSGLSLPEAALRTLAVASQSAFTDAEALSQTIAARDLLWRFAVGGITALAWLLTLLYQLVWRGRYLHPKEAARAAMRAVATYHWSMAALIALNLLGALVVYLLGVRWIAGRTGWDYALYFGGFALNPIAAALCFRLAAPPAISGRHAFFKRL